MDWLWDNIVGVITTVLAIYGAVLSSLNFWHMWERDKKELYIEAFFLQSLLPDWGDVFVSIANKSLRPITIKEYGFKYVPSSASKMVGPQEDDVNRKFPVILTQTSDQFSYDVPCCYFANEKEKFHHFDACAIPYAIDNEGQKYNGTPLQHPIYFVLGS